MQQHLMLTPLQYSEMPPQVSVVMDYGHCEVIPEGGSFDDAVSGTHRILEGPQEIFCQWLGRYEGVWVGKGTPISEQFSIMHSKPGITREKE